MALLRYAENVGRVMRVEDDLAELGQNTLGKCKELIKSGDKEEALAWADYVLGEGKLLHDIYVDLIYADYTWVAQHYGEEELPKLLRFQRSILESTLGKQAKLSQRDLLKGKAENMRAHRSGPNEIGDIKVWEEADRYVLQSDPCGSGGRVARGPLDGTGSRMKPPFNLGTTTKPYPWSWSRAGIPYYCLHCCVWDEVMAIEKIGYPIRVTEFETPDKQCNWYFYKDPIQIPEKYFERVGFKKDVSRIAL